MLIIFLGLWNEEDHKGIVQLRRQPDTAESVVSESSSSTASPSQVMSKRQSRDVLTEVADTNDDTSVVPATQVASNP